MRGWEPEIVSKQIFLAKIKLILVGKNGRSAFWDFFFGLRMYYNESRVI